MHQKKYFIVSLFCAIISFGLGTLSRDIILGGGVLFTGLLCAYFASEGKRLNYLLGFINYILMGYASLKNHLYGLFFFYVFLFAPLQIQGYVIWFLVLLVVYCLAIFLLFFLIKNWLF